MRVALAYFGITRSLRHTAASIACHIEAPLAEAGAEVRRVGHFHQPARIDNPRSGEHGIVPEPGDSALLGLDAVSLDAQDPALVAAEWALCQSGTDPFGDAYRSLHNLCFQLRSLHEAWRLAAEWAGSDGFVLFLRPDLLYLDRVDVPDLAHGMLRSGTHLLVPGWQEWGGLNDRFALCRGGHAAHAYATRATSMAALLEECGAVHPESLLAHAVDAARLRAGTMDARALRIRADGRPAPQDLAWFARHAPGTMRPMAV